MAFSYPAKLAADKRGNVTVSFRDIPEALTDGPDRQTAVIEAVDALIAALAGYMAEHRSIPKPSRNRSGEYLISLPPLVAAKLALYQSMMEQGMSRVALAKKLQLTESAIRRLLNLDHRSHIGQVDAALAVVGKRLIVAVQDAA
jgi:antitoxin HicB